MNKLENKENEIGDIPTEIKKRVESGSDDVQNLVVQMILLRYQGFHGIG